MHTWLKSQTKRQTKRQKTNIRLVDLDELGGVNRNDNNKTSLLFIHALKSGTIEGRWGEEERRRKKEKEDEEEEENFPNTACVFAM